MVMEAPRLVSKCARMVCSWEVANLTLTSASKSIIFLSSLQESQKNDDYWMYLLAVPLTYLTDYCTWYQLCI